MVMNKEEWNGGEEQQRPLGESAMTLDTRNLAAIANRSFEITLTDDIQTALLRVIAQGHSGKNRVGRWTIRS